MEDLMRVSVSRFLLIAGLAACVETPELGEDELMMEDASLAVQPYISRAARLWNCSGTRLTSIHVITAVHCFPMVDELVSFYSSGTPYPEETDTTRVILGRAKPPGTAWGYNTAADWHDSDDQFADLAIVTLSRPPMSLVHEITPLAWKYPGEDAWGAMVGGGAHYDNGDLFGILMQAPVQTSSGSDDDGDFYTHQDPGNPGDSGGGLHHSGRLLGVTHGADYLPDGWHQQFTSVPEHLEWILGEIGYQWSGTVPANAVLSGTSVIDHRGSHLRCQYACDHTSTCVGYNWNSLTNQCWLFSNVTGSIALPNFKSARRTP
jgi:hypothetical protein